MHVNFLRRVGGQDLTPFKMGNKGKKGSAEKNFAFANES
jgi:hypothetical protein